MVQWNEWRKLHVNQLPEPELPTIERLGELWLDLTSFPMHPMHPVQLPSGSSAMLPLSPSPSTSNHYQLTSASLQSPSPSPSYSEFQGIQGFEASETEVQFYSQGTIVPDLPLGPLIEPCHTRESSCAFMLVWNFPFFDPNLDL